MNSSDSDRKDANGAHLSGWLAMEPRNKHHQTTFYKTEIVWENINGLHKVDVLHISSNNFTFQ